MEQSIYMFPAYMHIEVNTPSYVYTTGTVADENDRLINLVQMLPSAYDDSEVYEFLKFFEDFLNYDLFSHKLNIENDSVKISILKKIDYLYTLRDPDVIDIDLIQYFANYLGYNINYNRDDIINITGDTDTKVVNDYLRETVRSLPHFYKMKTTNNAMSMIMYLFGVVSEVYTMWTNDYNENWAMEAPTYESLTSTPTIPDGYYPTPHFKISVDVDKTPSGWESNIDEIINLVDSIKPINTVFEGFASKSVIDFDGIDDNNRLTIFTSSSARKMKQIINMMTPTSGYPEPIITDFIMSGTTLSTGTPQITLGYLEPQDSETSFTIDWGDDTSSTYTNAVTDLSIVHTYPSNSTDYTISISQAQIYTGNTNGYFCNWTDSNNTWIDTIESFGVDFFTLSAYRAFYSLTTLTAIPDSWLGLENVQNIGLCFAHCTNLTAIPDSWLGLTNVTTMDSAFTHCTFEILPDSWVGLDSIDSLYTTFAYNDAITAIPDSWVGLETLTIMSNCFFEDENLTAIPDSWLGLTNVTTMDSCYRGCTSLTTIPDSWLGLEYVQNIDGFLYECFAIIALPESWEGLESLTTARSAFYKCNKITYLGLTSISSLSNVIDCYAMFKFCAKVTSDILPVYNQLVLSATSYNDCFEGLTLATNYASIPTAWK